MTTRRHDFSKQTQRIVAQRAGNLCSDPGCRAPTSGPQADPGKTINLGVAAHITAAAPGGPRYDPSLSEEERRSPENGIWLCQTCAKRIDNDVGLYTAGMLREWKMVAERDAQERAGRPAPHRDSAIGQRRIGPMQGQRLPVAVRLRECGDEIAWIAADEESERIDAGWQRVVDDHAGQRVHLVMSDPVREYLVLLHRPKANERLTT